MIIGLKETIKQGKGGNGANGESANQSNHSKNPKLLMQKYMNINTKNEVGKTPAKIRKQSKEKPQ